MKTLKNELKSIKEEIFKDVWVRVFYTLPNGSKKSKRILAQLLNDFKKQLKRNKCNLDRLIQE